MRVLLCTIGTDLRIEGALGAFGIGEAFDLYFETKGGVAPHVTRVLLDLLPDEATVTEEADGRVRVTGVAETPGDFSLTLRGVDSERESVDRLFVMRVIALPLELSGSIAPITVGTPTSQALTLSGGVKPRTIVASTLPAGISASLNDTTGVVTISGTATGVGLGAGYSKSFSASIAAEDAVGSDAGWAQSIIIAVPTLLWGPVYPAGQVGVAYDHTPAAATGGTGGYLYSRSGSIPAGLTFIAASGRLHGIPTTPGASAFTVTATDSEGNASTPAAQSVAVANAGDPYWANVATLLYGNSATLDEKGKAWTVTTGGSGVTVDAVDTQFGMPSLSFNNAQMQLTVGDDDSFDFVGGDFTIETRFKSASVTGIHVVFDKRANTSTFGGVVLQIETGRLRMYAFTGSGWAVSLLSPAAAIISGSWYSIGARRLGNSWQLWINNVMVASATVSGTVVNNTSPPRISPQNTLGAAAKIAQFRITKGVARDLSIPQTAPWPNS